MGRLAIIIDVSIGIFAHYLSYFYVIFKYTTKVHSIIKAQL